MPTYEVKSPDGATYRVNAPDGASQEDAIAYVQSNFKPQAAPTPQAQAPVAESKESDGSFVSNSLRNLGLAARAGMQGVATLPEMLGNTLESATGWKTGGNIGTTLADKIGLPSPQNSSDRVAADVIRAMTGAAVPVGIAGQVAKGSTGLLQSVAKVAAGNPGMQLLSGGAAGGAGGLVREGGGSDGEQMAASLLAGVAAPLAADRVLSAGRNISSAVKNRMAPPTTQTVVNVQISNALKDSGINLGDLAPQVRASIQRDVQAALDTGNQVSPDAIRRLADYRLTGTTPTAASLTLDPVAVTQQKNLAKLGANSKDVAAQQLSRVENANNGQIISNLNELGAANAGDQISGAQRVMGALNSRNDRAKSLIGQRYEAARAMDGRSADLNPAHFSQSANNLLDDALLGGKLPSDVRNLLNNAAKGEMPLTVDTAEQFKTRIGDLQRSSSDPAERKALGLVRQALDGTPLLDPAQMGQPAIDAFNRARALNRSWMNIVDRTPALQAVRDGIEQDKFMQQYIIGQGGNANVMDVAMLRNSIKGNPDAIAAVKGQMVDYLKTKSMSGAADEVGNVSHAAFNKALNAIGDRKLSMFFTPEEMTLLKANGRVASYEQFQPKGSAVNNSNTASAGLSAILDRIANSPLLSKIPLGRTLADPLQNISVGIQSKRAADVPAALISRRHQPPAPAGMLLSPMIFTQPQDDRRGLLSP